MKLRIAIAVALLVTAVFAAPASAAGNAYHFRSSGLGADAYWTTMPDTGPVVNVVYTDIYLSAAQQGYSDDGTSYSDNFLWFDQFSYKFDRNWNWVPISETYGFAGGSDVTLSVDRKLSSASASANVMTYVCTFGRRGTCAEGPVISVSGSWTAAGEITRVGGTYHASSKSFTYTSQNKGSYRDASATATIGGSSLGSSLFASISNFSSHDVWVCHGC